jgi:hypothetical protein
MMSVHPRSCKLQCCSGSKTPTTSPAFPALFCQFPISVVRCLLLKTRSEQEIGSCITNDTIRHNTKLECERYIVKGKMCERTSGKTKMCERTSGKTNTLVL